MKPHRVILAAAFSIALLMPFWAVQACGPFFEADVFVRNDSPDDLDSFAHGQLGILQKHFDSNEYAVAYRYLSGGQLSPAELAAYVPASAAGSARVERDWSKLTPAQVEVAREADKQATANASAPGKWALARAQFTSAPLPTPADQYFPKDWTGDIVFDPGYLNCPNPAFENATATLKARALAWGKINPWLADWIRAQDTVFANCTSKSPATPAAAPANAPALLLADRAYQFAAAAFYAKQYDVAIQQFDAIAKDSGSPWSNWGSYLAARATVRKAFAMGKATDEYSTGLADYDKATMLEAQHRLEVLLAQPNPSPSRAVVAGELNFVRIRTEPQERLKEISAALAGPTADANLHQDLNDLSWALIKGIPGSTPTTVPDPSANPVPKPNQHPPDVSPLLTWIAAWRTPEVDSAFRNWQRDHALPWMVLAISEARPEDKSVPDLLAAAEKIKPDSPAFETVFYHRTRLLIALNRTDEARTLLDRELADKRAQSPSSYRNALLANRTAVARTLHEFLGFAPRAILSDTYQAGDVSIDPCQPNTGPKQSAKPCDPHQRKYCFDVDAVDVLNQKTPLDVLVQAAHDPDLPTNLHQYVILAAWTRSVALEDQAHAAQLAPMLPASIRETAGTGVGFPASLAILRNPGLRPYLEPGVSRLGSFKDLDSYRNNWWNADSIASREPDDESASNSAPPALFLTGQQRAAGAAEYRRLLLQLNGSILIGHRVVNYAKDHRDDPAVPEALALTVRATHIGAQDWSEKAKAENAETTAVGKAAFQLLHARYPKSPWTAKTPYYY